MISLFDVLTNALSLFGNPPRDNIECFAQGVLMNFSASSSILWITFLSYMLYAIATTGKLPLRRRHLLAISLVVPSIKVFLPLTTLTYSSDGNVFCSLYFHSGSIGYTEYWTYIFWDLINYLIYLVVAIFLIVYFQFRIHRLVSAGTLSISSTVKVVLSALSIYPVLLILAYFLLLLVNILFVCGVDTPESLTTAGECLMLLHGTMIGVVFFWKSVEARLRWSSLLGQIYHRMGRSCCCYCCISSSSSDLTSHFRASDVSDGSSSTTYPLPDNIPEDFDETFLELGNEDGGPDSVDAADGSVKKRISLTQRTSIF